MLSKLHPSTAALLVAILPLASLAVPTPNNNITVVWQHDKGTLSKSLQVWNTDETTLYGEACNDTINTGAFAKKPISFDVNDNGFGTVTYGSLTYNVHSKIEHSRGITCTKRFNGDNARVDCEIPAQEVYQPMSYDTIAPLQSCFSGDHRGFGSILNHKSPSSGFSTVANSQAPAHNNTKREVLPPVCDPIRQTLNVGDGNPHQNYWDSQLSDNINCDAATQCQVGEQNSQSFTIGFTAEATLDEWITGGFSVEASWETGNDYECVGSTGDEVCIWYSTAHTAYTVQNFDADDCAAGVYSDPFVLFSPNTNNDGGAGYYCVIGACRSKGQGYWDYSGPAGGPP